MAEDRSFSSVQEEATYWKGIAHQYKQSLEEAREELDEFQISSRELESELEAQLEQYEGRNKELTSANARLDMEIESLRERLEQQQQTGHKQITELQDELAQVTAYKDELQRYIRELEQSNDDLERTKRATVVSLEDFEARLNMAIERNAFLESELEEKDMLAITVQRLKDEARDLKNELNVERKVPSMGETPVKEKLDSPVTTPALDQSTQPQQQQQPVDSNKLAEELITPTGTPSKMQSFLNHTGSNGTPLTPSARISALNIVGDLLRKVGALESKLASCKNFVHHQPRSGKAPSSSPMDSPRAKRMHRGAASGCGGAPSSTSTTSTSSTLQQSYKITV